MSVIVGCSLFNGILLAADSRGTIQCLGCPDVYVDNVQKLFTITFDTAIGFVGDFEAASILLQSLKSIGRHRRDPISLSRWMPRLFRYQFSKLKPRKDGCPRDVAFVVASLIRGRPNRIHRASVRDVLRHIVEGRSAVKRNWVPSILLDILSAEPQEAPYVMLQQYPQNLLYRLQSPRFQLQLQNTPDIIAIGSGGCIVEKNIFPIHDMILAIDTGDEALWLREAMLRFVQSEPNLGVGGLFPILKLTEGQIEGISHQVAPIGHTDQDVIQLICQNGRWTQQNLSTGKRMELKPPWELFPLRNTRNLLFDDLKDQY